MVSKSTFKYPFPEPKLFDDSRMLDLVEKNYMLNRSAVNPETDIFTKRLEGLINGRVLEAQAGDLCLKWKIPDNWNVKKGILRKMDGEVLADFANHPMYLWTHSIPFCGEISREDLLKNHVISDPKRPNEFSYHYMHGYREDIRTWGFSLPHNLVLDMRDEKYYVEIDSELNLENTIKVVDSYLEGETKETIFIMAHTCHPGMVSDGIACIAVANEIFFNLQKRRDLKYSYRFIYGPEYWGGACWLQLAPKKDIKNLKYGIFLDMLSTFEPLGYQESAFGGTLIDRIAHNVMESHLTTFIHREYRKLWGNDETFYSGHGYEIPTIGVGRGMHREYHYNTDNLENMSLYKMQESAWILSRIIEVFESDFIPILNYSGPLYLSRYGLFIEPYFDRKGYDALEKIQILADGKNSCFDIADTLGIDFFFVKEFFDKLIAKELCAKAK